MRHTLRAQLLEPVASCEFQRLFTGLRGARAVPVHLRHPLREGRVIPHRRHRPAPGGFAKCCPHFIVETGHRQSAGHGFDIAARGIGLLMATQENIRIPPHMGYQFALEIDRFMQGDMPRKIIPRDIGGDAFLKAPGPEDIEAERHTFFTKDPRNRDQILRTLHRLKPPGKHQAQGSVV